MRTTLWYLIGRRGMIRMRKTFNTKLEEELIKALRHLAIDLDCDVNDLLEAAAVRLLEEYNRSVPELTSEKAKSIWLHRSQRAVFLLSLRITSCHLDFFAKWQPKTLVTTVFSRLLSLVTSLFPILLYIFFYNHLLICAYTHCYFYSRGRNRSDRSDKFGKSSIDAGLSLSLRCHFVSLHLKRSDKFSRFVTSSRRKSEVTKWQTYVYVFILSLCSYVFVRTK